MATAAPTRKKAPARKKTTARKRADNGQSPADLLQGALDDLTAARERASDDIRSGIDSAIDRTRDALREAGSDAQAQIGDWRRRQGPDLTRRPQGDGRRDPQAEDGDRRGFLAVSGKRAREDSDF